uniref:Long neuropeptide F n=1 Tax=Rhodnius prolixus TaxID=13249 RepID=LNF_RHOPR|nr:RecName: Full=Long neuropeptide F; Short=Rhopr-LNF [Rhodnius prolixus]
VAAGRPRF